MSSELVSKKFFYQKLFVFSSWHEKLQSSVFDKWSIAFCDLVTSNALTFLWFFNRWMCFWWLTFERKHFVHVEQEHLLGFESLNRAVNNLFNTILKCVWGAGGRGIFCIKKWGLLSKNLSWSRELYGKKLVNRIVFGSE